MKTLVILLVLASTVLAHGGVYVGPVGGGTPAYNGPIGGGTVGPQPGGSTPSNPLGGGATPPTNGGGATPTPPSHRFGPPTPASGGRGFGGSTGRSKAKSNEAEGDWIWWWELNDDMYLDFRNKANKPSDTENKDSFLGGGGDLNGSNKDITLRHIRNGILPSLNKGLSDPYYDARAAAAIALGRTNGDPESVGKLIHLLEDSDYRVREAACIGLGLLGSLESIDKLKSCIGQESQVARFKFFASLAIGQIISKNKGDFSSHIDYLINIADTKESNIDSNLGAIIGLSMVSGEKSSAYLESTVKNEGADQMLRAYAALSLGKKRSYSSSELLAQYANDNSKILATSCIIALGTTTKDTDTETINKLIRISKTHQHRSAKNFAMISLGKIGSGKAIASLISNVDSGGYDDLTFSALGLSISGMKDDGAKSQSLVRAYYSQKDPKAKAAIAISLGILGDKSTVPMLLKDLSDPNGTTLLKGYLCVSLGMLGATDATNPMYNLLLQKGAVDSRKQAAIGLGLLRDASAIDTIAQHIKTSQNNKSDLAAYTLALGYIGDARAVKPLIDLSLSESEPQRAFAYVALGLLGDKNAVSDISKMQEDANYMAQTQAIAELLTIM